jgi:rod shape-determining protein MreD
MAMRASFTVLLALALLLLQSALVELLPPSLPAPAFGVLVALHVGLSPRWSRTGQVLLAFFTGYLFDLCAGAPHGTHALVYTVTALLVGPLGRRVAVRSFLARTAASFGATLVAGLAVVTIRAIVSRSGGFAGLRWVPVEATFTALVGPVVLGLLERIDGRAEGPRTQSGLHRRRRRVLGRSGQLPLG